MNFSNDTADTQTFLLNELSRVNLTDLMLDREGEDVFECSDGCVSIKKSSKEPRFSPGQQYKSEMVLEISEEGARAIRLEQRRRAKQQQHRHAAGSERRSCGLISFHDVDSEETMSQKIEKIMNRIVVRRQRAYLTGLLRDPSKARTAKLIEVYQKNCGIICNKYF